MVGEAAVGGEEVRGGGMDRKAGGRADAAGLAAVACSSGGLVGVSVVLLSGQFSFPAFVLFSFLLVAFPLPLATFEPVTFFLLFTLFHDPA